MADNVFPLSETVAKCLVLARIKATYKVQLTQKH